MDYNKLGQVKGIGEWTIQTVKLSMLESLDIFPEKDYFIRKRLQILYPDKFSSIPTPVQARILAQSWAPYRSIVTWYLWRWRM